MANKFSPMAAVNIKPEQVHPDSYGSIKLEGVRGEVTPEGLLTRQLKPFGNPLMDELMDPVIEFCNCYSIILEGEFYLHGTPFADISGATRGKDNKLALQLEFHVFDCYAASDPEATFTARINFYSWCVEMLHKHYNATFVKAVEQTLTSDPQYVLKAYANAIDHNYEGYVLKLASAPYKHGRSTLKQGYFARIKPEETYEAVVMEIVERQHNLLESEINELGMQYKRQDKDAKAGAGIAQTAVCYCSELDCVLRVSLTRGLKDYETTDHGVSREVIWNQRHKFEGKMLRFVGIPVPGDLRPRSPRFDDWRFDIDCYLLAHDESDALMVETDFEKSQEMQEMCRLVDAQTFNALYKEGYQLGK